MRATTGIQRNFSMRRQGTLIVKSAPGTPEPKLEPANPSPRANQNFKPIGTAPGHAGRLSNKADDRIIL